MNLWKLGALLTFGIITGICVNYAHSAEVTETLNYKTSSFFGGCSLKVEKIEGGWADFTPGSESRTKFEGVWPAAEGEVYMESPSMPSVPQEKYFLGAEPSPKETLKVKFLSVNGNLRPVSYIYDSVWAREKSRGLIQPKQCSGLSLQK